MTNILILQTDCLQTRFSYDIYSHSYTIIGELFLSFYRKVFKLENMTNS